jgi:MFS family permease
LALSGTLATFGWNYPFLSYSIAFIVTIGTFFFIFEPRKAAAAPHTGMAPPPATWPVATIVRLCLITLVAAILYFVYTLHFSLALDAIGIKDRQQIGNISAIASIAVPVGALLFKWTSRYSIRIQLTLVAALLGVGLAGIGVSTGTVAITTLAWIQQLGAGMAIPTLIAWALNCLPAEFRGRGMGFWTSAFFFGQFVSPFVVGFVRETVGGILPAFLALGVVCLVLAAANFLLNTGAQAGDGQRP